MKITLRWILLLLLLPLAAFAADVVAADPVTPPAAAGQLSSLLLLLIPVLVPLIVAIGKFAIPKAPLWVLPILAPALGALLDYLTSLGTGGTANPLVGALLGSAGVGVRELVDQIKGRMAEAPKVLPMLLLCLALPTVTMGVAGCAWLKNTPVETVKYYTFKDSWSLTKAAYDGFSERVVLGKVAAEKVAEVDLAWNKYRSAFRSALSIARQDFSAATPATLLQIQNDLLTLIATLSK